MVQKYPSMSWRTVVNVSKLILHNLENTDGIPYNMLINSINTFYSTVWVPKCISIILCQFEDHQSDALPKMTQSGKHGIFRGKFRGIFSKVLKLILNGSKWSKHTTL